MRRLGACSVQRCCLAPLCFERPQQGTADAANRAAGPRSSAISPASVTDPTPRTASPSTASRASFPSAAIGHDFRVLLPATHSDRRIVAVIGTLAGIPGHGRPRRHRRASRIATIAAPVALKPSPDRNPPRPARGRTASPRRAHSCRRRHWSGGRWPAATAGGGRSGCPSSSARRPPGSPRTCRGPARRSPRAARPSARGRAATGRPRGSRGGTARRWPRRRGYRRRAAAGMTLKSPASTSGSSALSRSFEYSRSRDIHLSL